MACVTPRPSAISLPRPKLLDEVAGDCTSRYLQIILSMLGAQPTECKCFQLRIDWENAWSDLKKSTPIPSLVWTYQDKISSLQRQKAKRAHMQRCCKLCEGVPAAVPILAQIVYRLRRFNPTPKSGIRASRPLDCRGPVKPWPPGFSGLNTKKIEIIPFEQSDRPV